MNTRREEYTSAFSVEIGNRMLLLRKDADRERFRIPQALIDNMLYNTDLRSAEIPIRMGRAHQPHWFPLSMRTVKTNSTSYDTNEVTPTFSTPRAGACQLYVSCLLASSLAPNAGRGKG